MSESEEPRRGGDGMLAGGAFLMILCCAVGPAAVGAAAGSAVGGWVGIACAVLVAAIAGLFLHRRRSRQGC